MPKEIFEKIVRHSINKIPDQFRKELDNVNFFVEDWPSQEQIRKIRLQKGHTLLGLYEGVPLSKRGTHYHSVLPDKITLFRIPLLQFSKTIDDLVERINDTVWHEVGHYFGLNEKEVREAEARRKNKAQPK